MIVSRYLFAHASPNPEQGRYSSGAEDVGTSSSI
jgi:hypothetical protein